MGNQQALGLQVCSTENNSLLTERFMVDKDFRIDYQNTVKLPRKQQVPVQHQQKLLDVTRQEQEPEKTVKVPLCKSEIQLVDTSNVSEVQEKKFEGLFGCVKLQADGLVKYVDSTGMQRREMFDRKEIRKTFPLGISLGGLTKSLWFKDAWEREVCFEYMSAPAGVTSVETTQGSECEDTENTRNCTVFTGIKGNEVFIYQDNHVVYTDLDGKTHNVSYKMSKIKKCFPSGICFGGLPRTVWLNDESERDRCYTFMKLQTEEKSQEKEPEKNRIFTGLYGDVSLKSDYEIEFTSLNGERMTSSYDPRGIRMVYPMGICSNTFPSTIWFEEMEDCESCFNAMKETC